MRHTLPCATSCLTPSRTSWLLFCPTLQSSKATCQTTPTSNRSFRLAKSLFLDNDFNLRPDMNTFLESPTIPNLEAVKAAQKAAWESGDFEHIARTLENVAEEFMARQ